MPVHNEATTIEKVLRGYYAEIAAKLQTEIVICEDGSKDDTPEVLSQLAESLPLRVVRDTDRLGYAKGVIKGLRLVDGDVVFFSDSDGQYNPKDFWFLAQHLGNRDMIVGRKVKRDDAFHRIILSKGFHLLAKILFDIDLHDIDCGFRLIRKNVINDVLDLVYDLPYSFWAEFTILAVRRGHDIGEIPISHRNRLHGSTTIYQPKRLPRIILAQFLGLLHLRRRTRRQGIL